MTHSLLRCAVLTLLSRGAAAAAIKGAHGGEGDREEEQMMSDSLIDSLTGDKPL